MKSPGARSDLVSVAEFITVRFQHQMGCDAGHEGHFVSVAEFITVRFQPVLSACLFCQVAFQ